MTLTVRLPPKVDQALDAYCAEHGLTKSHVVQQSLAVYLVHGQSGQRLEAAPKVSGNFAAFKRAGLIGCATGTGDSATKEVVRQRASQRLNARS